MTSRRELTQTNDRRGIDLLRSLLAAELLTSSNTSISSQQREIWMVSPWITDFVILDNRFGAWGCLNVYWAKREIYFSELMGQFVLTGGTLNVVMNNDAMNKPFGDYMRRLSINNDIKGNARIGIIDNKNFHPKGMLSNNFFLRGSRNTTKQGFMFNQELVELDVDKNSISDARVKFTGSYGDCLS